MSFAVFDPPSGQHGLHRTRDIAERSSSTLEWMAVGQRGLASAAAKDAVEELRRYVGELE